MSIVLNPSCVTADSRALATALLAKPDNLVIAGALADSLEEAGCDNVQLLLDFRKDDMYNFHLAYTYSPGMDEFLGRMANDYDFGPDYFKFLEMRAESAKALHIKERNTICVFAAGVTGNSFTMKNLEARITRTRPRGSGSKKDLAKRLSDAMDTLAEKRWATAKKGQRKPSSKHLQASLEQIEAALLSVQGRARERCIDTQAVIAAARGANRDGKGTRNGGEVTCNSYKYSWSTTTADAVRMADGTIRVRLTRTGTREIILTARTWAALATPVAVLA